MLPEVTIEIPSTLLNQILKIGMGDETFILKMNNADNNSTSNDTTKCIVFQIILTRIHFEKICQQVIETASLVLKQALSKLTYQQNSHSTSTDKNNINSSGHFRLLQIYYSNNIYCNIFQYIHS